MLDFIKEKKNFVIIIIIIILAISYVAINYFTKDDTSTDINILENMEISEEKENRENLVVVHITGAVNKPGIVKLKEGSRIEDAIEAAGGLNEDSDITNVNLAYILEDGTKIKIPTIDDMKNNKDSNYIIENSGSGVIISEENEISNTIININKANQTELETLPGIGPSLADRIINYREEKGKFSKIEDIKNVTGIGDSKYSNIKDLIKVK